MKRLLRITTVTLFSLAAALLVACSRTAEPTSLPLLPGALPRPDGAVRLTWPPEGASDQNPAYSPDGARLVFTRFERGYDVGPAGLFLLELGDNLASRLTPVEDWDHVNLPGAAWDGTGDRIAFASDRMEADDLWCVSSDGAKMDRLTTHGGLPRYHEPSWSPDGRWVVFEASRPADGEDGRVGEIWKVRDDGEELTQLTGGPGLDDRQPNWSPAGGRILFQRRALPDGRWDVYTVAPDGGRVENVTNSPSMDETDGSWSPNGACIVYAAAGPYVPVPDLFAIPAAGGLSVRVTSSEAAGESAPSWSPDGRWIAFESRDGEDEEAPASLWRVDVTAYASQELTPCVYLPLAARAWSARPALSSVDDFLYQLQDLDLAAVGDTAFDLVVMDYSVDGGEWAEYSAAQIDGLKHSPGGEKIVLAYMSIGEAEDYRFYWQAGWTPGSPAWLDVENPDWAGNYKVHYWDPGWQTIVLSYTNRLLDAGFDGAYLDIIDAYEYYEDQGRATAPQEMADFVAAIRAYARARDADFLVFPQNAPELAQRVAGYLDGVDGIGQEDIYYGYDGDDVMTPPAATAEMEGYLDLFTAAGKLVLTVDYATTPAHVDDAYAKSQAKGYVPYVTVRDLDQLVINPGHEPD